jgi:hypothetical protein
MARNFKLGTIAEECTLHVTENCTPVKFNIVSMFCATQQTSVYRDGASEDIYSKGQNTVHEVNASFVLIIWTTTS